MSALGSAVSPSVRGQVYSVKSRSIKAVRCRAPVSVKAQIDNVAAAPVSAPRNDRPWFDVASARPRDVEDPFAVLQAQRVIFLGGEVDEMSADAVISQMLLLDAKDPMKDIKIFINSPGGSVTAGMGIYDAMHMCKGDISTLCFGLAASMGAFLLCAGKKGKRYSLPNSRIMIHQPLGGAGGQAIDIEIQAKEIMYHKANLNRIMADNCDQPLNKMEADCDRDNYMNPIEAREYGLIDHIVGGDNKTYAVKGSMRRYPKLNKEYVTDKEDMLRSIIDGAPFLEYTPSYRFRKESEPYMRSLAPASPWFRLEQVSKERYKEMIDTQKAAQLEDKAAGVVDVEVKKPAKPVLL